MPYTTERKEMSFTNTVIHLLKDENLSVNAIAAKTGLSINYVRVQLRFMEQSGVIEKVDERLPIIYKVSPTNMLVRNADAIANAKKDLLSDNGDNDMGKFIKKFPKKYWPDAANAMDAYSAAIRELESDNKLIDTL